MNDEQFNALIASLQNGFNTLGQQQAEVAATLSGAVDTYIQGAETDQERKRREKTFRTTKQRVISETDPKEKREMLEATKKSTAALLKPLSLVGGAIGAIKGGLGMITGFFNAIFSVLPFGGILKAGLVVGGAILGFKALKAFLDKPGVQDFLNGFKENVKAFVNNTIGFLYTLFTGNKLDADFDIFNKWNEWKAENLKGKTLGQFIFDKIRKAFEWVLVEGFGLSEEEASMFTKNVTSRIKDVTDKIQIMVDTVYYFVTDSLQAIREVIFKASSLNPYSTLGDIRLQAGSKMGEGMSSTQIRELIANMDTFKEKYGADAKLTDFTDDPRMRRAQERYNFYTKTGIADLPLPDTSRGERMSPGLVETFEGIAATLKATNDNGENTAAIKDLKASIDQLRSETSKGRKQKARETSKGGIFSGFSGGGAAF